MKNYTSKILVVLLIVSVFSLTVLLAQDNLSSKEDNFITTDSGLKYKIVKKGDGPQPKQGERVKVDYTGKLENGKVFDSSIQRGEPITFTLGAGRVIPGWDEGIALLHLGDKAIFIIPPELGYGARQVGPIPANSTLTFEIELLDIVPQIKAEEYDVQGKEIQETDSGLMYIIVEKGEGENAENGKTVTVHYSGYLEDGTMFDSSIKRDQPLVFPLGKGRVIPGWELGISLMKEGAKYRLIIPPELAYGKKGIKDVIPPDEILTFDVELIEVK